MITSPTAAGSFAAGVGPGDGQTPVQTRRERASSSAGPATLGTTSTAMGGRTGLRDFSALVTTAAVSILTHPPVANPVHALAIARYLSVGDLAAAYGLAPPATAETALAVEPPALPGGTPSIGTRASRDGRAANRAAGTTDEPPQAAEPTRLPRGPTGPQGGGLSLGAGGGAATPLVLMIVLGLIAAPCLGLVTRFRVHIQPIEGYRLERPG
jgi:hypothetical protein